MSQTSIESGYGSDNFINSSPNNFYIRKDARKFERKYKVLDLIMQSANGVIYSGSCNQTGSEVVIKQIPRGNISGFKMIKNRLCPNEIYYQLIANKTSENVVKVLDWFEKKSSFVIVMEKPENSCDLFELINEIGGINEDAAKIVVSFAVEYLEAGYIHRDIKDENILINGESLEIKMIDFGCASEFEDYYENASGTVDYFPPEWFQYHQYKPDELTVWSIGCLLYNILMGDVAYKNGFCNRNFQAESELSTEGRNIINQLLEPNPNIRIPLQNILKHNWFL